MKESSQDWYDLIGVPRYASRDAIEQACLQLADKFRPDKNLGDAAAARKFADIEAAYKTLTNASSRAEYDREFFNAGTTMAEGTDRRYLIEFSASASEYFRIWVVNLALTILTLGIYSAWAKVRKKRYFYAHTKIDGEGFEYRGDPIAILKGRAIAVALFATYALSEHISPVLQGVLLVAGGFALPWFVVRSLAFNSYNSLYRNIRFRFLGTYLEALKLMLLSGLLNIITLGIAYPYVQARLTRFAASEHQYGATRFALPLLTKAFYGIYGRLIGTILLAIVAIVLAVALASVFGKGMRLSAGNLHGLREVFAGGMFVLAIASMYVFYLFVFSYVRARTTNLLWNNLSIGRAFVNVPPRLPGLPWKRVPTGRVRFECHTRARDFAWLYTVNIFAIIVTVGLATPWAVVRTMRYRAECMTMLTVGGIDEFATGEESSVGATGEAIGDFMNFDFGL